MNYDLKTIRINSDYISKNAYAITRDRIGVIPENPDYVIMRYCQPPIIKSNLWEEECLMTAKEDVLFRLLVKQEFAAAVVDALSY